MGSTNWTITGTGGQAIIDDAGSKRCRLSGSKLMLWNGNAALANSEIVGEIQISSSSNSRGGLVLRCDSTMNRCYRLAIYGTRIYYVQKVVSGLVTTLTTAVSTRPWNEYTKTRLRIDGYQLSVEEYYNGIWNLVVSIIDTEQSIVFGSAGLYGESVNTSYWVTFDNIEISQRP